MDLVVPIAAGAILAGFVQGLSGFAFGMVAMSVWAWTLEPHLAAALSVFGAFTGQVIAALTMRRDFDRAILLPFLAGGLIGIPLGVALLPHLDVDLFKMALGGLLVLWCPTMLFARRLPRAPDGGAYADGAIGLAGGIMAGVGGFSGPVPTLWCTMRGMNKDRQRSVIQNFNLVTLGVTLAAYFVNGTATIDMAPMFAVVAAASLVPVLLGGRVYIGISETTFRRIVLTLLTCSGVAFLASSVPKLLARTQPPLASVAR